MRGSFKVESRTQAETMNEKPKLIFGKKGGCGNVTTGSLWQEALG